MRAIRAAAPALAAALLFGASTPLAKLLVGDVPPLLLAGLLYLGSGLGLGAVLAARLALRGGGLASLAAIPRRDTPWLAAAIVAGGVLGPALLMLGLAATPAASASLLLNLESVLTAAIAWLVFRENADRGIVAGMAAIAAGGVVLSVDGGATAPTAGSLLIVAACACWAVDNNLTRKVSGGDAMAIACVKGLVAGVCNVALALATGAPLPALPLLAASLLLGFIGYGVSLTLFVVALRTLGTARSGAYFALAPLIGAAVALAIWPASPSWPFAVAALLMAAGVWLHLRERHRHAHVHEPMAHEHAHRHDAHHRHEHDPPVAPGTTHSHRHVHAALAHEHAHYPDLHHRHVH